MKVEKQNVTPLARRFAIEVLNGAPGERFTGYASIACSQRDGGSGGPIVRFRTATGHAYELPTTGCRHDSHEVGSIVLVQVRSAHRTSFIVRLLMQ